MKKLLLLSLTLFCVVHSNYSQVISIIGDTSPSGSWSIDTNLTTTDNITYTLNNVTLTTATGPSTGLKFRQDGQWTTNWGGNFPNGTGVQDGPNIQTIAGTYDITFNRSNGTYTFISNAIPTIGIWGPAVDSQNGFGGADVDMTTLDGINYTLSGFNFSSGTAYFRANDATVNVWGSTAFPSGTAQLTGPSIPVIGGEWFVSFNRITGAYSFTYPNVGILGTALNGFNVEDTDLTTTDGFTYTILNLTLTDGLVKFRKDNTWQTNWGSLDFPNGTGTQNGPDIPVTAGTYNVAFDRSTGDYTFSSTLSNVENSRLKVTIYPNPTQTTWNVVNTTTIDGVDLFDVTGKMIQSFVPNAMQFQLNGAILTPGIYFVKVKSGTNFTVQKIIRN